AQLLTSEGEPTACAWRLPDAGWALAAAVFLHERYAVQSRGAAIREVGWVQSSAMLVRRKAAERVGWLDPDFFVYSDETDFCRRLHDAGWRILFVPQAHAVHHDQLTTDAAAMRRRIVEFHRNRDLYFAKHRMPVTRALWRVCWTWAYLVRAAAALALPGHDPRRYLIHARQQLVPSVGEGIREAAEAYNATKVRAGGAR
ncbi:MAG: glycosyltransferase family 2 protein, partial [Thermoleophilaceae bacterium]